MNRYSVMALALVVMLATMSVGIAEDSTNLPRLEVTGEGRASSPVDSVVLLIGVETTDLKASVAVAQNADLMSQVMAALEDNGVGQEKMKTVEYSVAATQPDWDETEQQRPREFVVTNRLQVDLNLSDFDIAPLVDAAVDSGANNVQINFAVRDLRPLKEAALEKAITEARSKAKVMATAAGVELGPIRAISEGFSLQPTMGAVAFDRAATPLVPGSLEVTASVSLIYDITSG
ncbi:MAG: oxidative stress defense protein [Methanosaeta sp. PtaB.Bin039]|nr:MAG: oxidative stress defense protein [Methanosaeta sp. PtaB.Bin039]